MDNGKATTHHVPWGPGPDLLFTNIARNPCAFSNGNGEHLQLRAGTAGQDLLYTTNSGGNLPMGNGEWNLELRASCAPRKTRPTITTGFRGKPLAMDNGEGDVQPGPRIPDLR